MAINKIEFLRSKVKTGSVEEELLDQIKPEVLPRHIAVIMDGNGRWAKSRGKPRIAGHREGVKSVREIVENSARLGIKVLTIFAFSVENWKRPEEEINALMKMLSEFLRKEVKNLIKNGIRFRPIGRWLELPEKTIKDIKSAAEATANGERLLFQVALNYSGRTEIVDACRKIAEECLRHTLKPGEIGEQLLSERMYSPDLPYPDLLIRTSGEYRISNFLLWGIAYSELYITDVYWPDFRLEHLLKAIIDYQNRERRFGGLNGGKY